MLHRVLAGMRMRRVLVAFNTWFDAIDLWRDVDENYVETTAASHVHPLHACTCASSCARHVHGMCTGRSSS